MENLETVMEKSRNGYGKIMGGGGERGDCVSVGTLCRTIELCVCMVGLGVVSSLLRFCIGHLRRALGAHGGL